MSTLQETKTASKKWILLLVMYICVNGLIMGANVGFSPLNPLVVADIPMSYAQLGLFTGMTGIISIICTVPSGVMMRRYGARYTCMIAVVLAAVGLFILAFANNYFGAVVGRGIWNVGIRLNVPAMVALMAIVTPEKHKSKGLGFNYAISTLAGVIIMRAGASVANSSGWRSAVILFGVLAAVSALFVIFGFEKDDPRKQPKTEAAAETDAAKPKGKSSVFMNPYIYLFLIVTILGIGIGTIDNIAVMQMTELWGTTSLEFSAVASNGLMIGIPILLLAGWLGDKFGRWNMLIIAGILNLSVGIFLLVGEGSIGLFSVGVIIAKAMMHVPLTFINSIIPGMKGLAKKDIATVVAIIAFGTALGQYLVPQLLGILRDITGSYTTGWIYLIVSGLVAVALTVVLKIHFEGRKSEAAVNA